MSWGSPARLRFPDGFVKGTCKNYIKKGKDGKSEYINSAQTLNKY